MKEGKERRMKGRKERTTKKQSNNGTVNSRREQMDGSWTKLMKWTV